MKLSALASNDEATFPAIDFRSGLNVVFARVQNPMVHDRDSHNLGKTFLTEVIDFMLLKTIDKDHPFKRFPDHFRSFIFYLEVLTPGGQWITIRRAIEGRKPCHLLISPARVGPVRSDDDVEWSATDLSLNKAEKMLGELLEMTAMSPFSFRKGLGYVMRRQSDWDEVFWLDRFRRGRDRDWKPYVAKLLGFDASVVTEKYEIDDRVKSLEQLLQTLEREAGTRSSEYGRVKGLIELKQSAVARQRSELEQFSFRELEAEVNNRGVGAIEQDISRLNERRYTIDYELQEIERSLETDLPFDIERIRQIFEEAQVAFSTSVSRSYEELIEFNRRISSARRDRLADVQKQLVGERDAIEVQLERLDLERQDALRLLRERETFQKYVRLQAEIRAQEQEIAGMERRLDKLDVAATTHKEIQEAQAKIAHVVESLREAVRKGNPRLSEIRRLFAEFVQEVLSVPALLSVNLNDSGNLSFEVLTLDRYIAERETSEASGTSYKKMLCACFDLALVAGYAKDHYYRFVFHDGVLEGLDNRKKVALLELVRGLCSSLDLQYILTVIDSDVPRDDRDNKLLFANEEIVRELHDQGDSGRLFRMKAF